MDYQDALIISRKTSELIESKGYANWRCKALNGEGITIVSDSYSGETKYTRYTIDELEIMCEAPNPRIIHEAVKAGARFE